MGTRYKQAGVDREAHDAFLSRVKPLAQLTYSPQVLAGVGGFCGAFELPEGYRRPVLIAAADGVGTKLKVAAPTRRHRGLGQDLVAMCVNDVLTAGARPLFFLDQLSTGVLDPDALAEVVLGISQACEATGCALLGGETAQMPGMFAEGEYDLAGFCVGVVEKQKRLTGQNVRAGDSVVGMASSGLHANGFSLVRRILLEENKLSLFQKPPGLSRPLVEELLEPTRLYAKEVETLLDQVELKALAHITGGGLLHNLPRALPAGTCAVLDEKSWRRPAIFDLLQKLGGLDSEELWGTFNCGLGMLAIMPSPDAPAAVRHLKEAGCEAWEVGRIEASDGPPSTRVVA